MKKFLIYTILFCLGFLNIPRSLVHDCDYHNASTTSEEGNDATVHFEQDTCFVCEFQLDFFEIPTFSLHINSISEFLGTRVLPTQKVAAAQVDSFSLRGPPIV